jgi:chemotaxis protein methyltransferase CheR
MNSITDSELLLIIQTIRAVSSYDFSEYSDKSLKRRFIKILMDCRITTAELIYQLRTQPKFAEDIAKRITVNTTEMFRVPPAWFSLRGEILPKLAQKPVIRIWHAGCSTGQEVYSMIILLNEMGLLGKAELYASDLNTDVIDIAKSGIYKYKFNIGYLDNFDKVIRNDINNPLVVRDIPYSKYFDIDHVTDRLKIHDEFLKIPTYSKLDLVNDGNLFHVTFDLIMCRNVIIYFNYGLQNKIFQLFHNSLCNDGFFMLGIHECILGPFSTKFEKKGYYYIKK